jgi:branched-chain amino acid transport system ATP-binding protein
MSAKLLELRNLEVRYGGITALKAVDLHVGEGELVAIIGSNGAGKTTLLKAVSGLLRPSAGGILFLGSPIGGLPAHRVTALGIAHSPEGRKVFSTQTVEDNLLLGAYLKIRKEGRRSVERGLDRAYAIFPLLKERRDQAAGTLSGGQQQMLAIARALMSEPKLLMLDEPSMGLAPIVIDEVFRAVKQLRDAGGVTVLLVEQLAYRALQLADRAYVLEQGQVRVSGNAAELLGSPEVRRAYLGGGAGTPARG